jgi:hypothetical protein
MEAETDRTFQTPAAACFVAAGMCLIALFDLPYGYYMLLRLVVCAACVYAALGWMAVGVHWPLIVLALTALVYNPIFRVGFEREVWQVLNVAAAVVLSGSGFGIVQADLAARPQPPRE